MTVSLFAHCSPVQPVQYLSSVDDCEPVAVRCNQFGTKCPALEARTMSAKEAKVVVQHTSLHVTKPLRA